MKLRSVLFLALAAATFSVGRAQQGNVEELRQLLMQQQAEQMSDDQIAQQLARLELTECLTNLTLEQMMAEFKPGEKTITELNLLADMSAFLEPPARELPDKDPPGAAEQQQMLREVANFATVTLKHLPDFLATRTTNNFADVPILTNDLRVQSGMHPIGSSVGDVAYRNGLEFSRKVADAATEPSRTAPSPALSSSGEFGPVLATIMTDSAAGKITWSHWEQTSAGPAAVFRYEVPQASAHYLIDFCCWLNQETRAMDSYHGKPAYHGSITVDPSTGSVLRLTLEADLDSTNPPEHFGLLVRYGSVEIGDSNLICPLESAVLFRAVVMANKRSWNVIHLNQVSFTNYRRFGSTARILSNAPPQ